MAVSSEKDSIQFPGLVNLTDFANIYAAVSSLKPKSVCKLTKINLSYIRDAVSSGVLSFIDASPNLSDVGANSAGDVPIFRSFVGRGGSQFLFAADKGRKSFATLKNRL